MSHYYAEKDQRAFLNPKFITFKFVVRIMTSNPFYFHQTCLIKELIQILWDFNTYNLWVFLWGKEWKKLDLKLSLMISYLVLVIASDIFYFCSFLM